ncbi:MAG TPA: hypothetical protein VII11_11640 [Bacteroidota bacterium]
MEPFKILNGNIEILLDDVKRISMLVEDAGLDVELLDAQPYQEARVAALKERLSAIDSRLRQLRDVLSVSHQYTDSLTALIGS